MFETAPQAIVVLDGSGRIVLANTTLETMFGYGREEILGRPVEILLPGRNRKALAAYRRDCASPPKNRPMGVGIDLAAVRKSGAEFPVQINLSYPPMEAGTLAVAFFTDVTDRKRSEEALRESEERMRLAQQVSRVATFELNFQTGVSRWTPELEAMYGLAPGSFAGTEEAWEKLVHPDDWQRAARLLRQAVNTGKFEGEWRVIWPDGTVRWLAGRGSVLRDATGKPLHLIGLNLDVTEQKRAQNELRESNDRFRNMADHSPVMIWVSGPDKLCTFFNKRWLDFVGRTMEQESGNGWAEGVHPDDLDRCIETYSRAFDERRSFQMEYRLRRADGEYRWLLDSGGPRLSEGGTFTGYIGSCIDITDMKETREQVFRAQKLESLGVLAGGIAHDFNNLLGSVLVEAESILSEIPRGSPGHEEAGHIKSVAVRAAEIVRQLMAYAGKETAAFDAVDLNRLIGEMLELLRVSISKNANLTIRLAENLPAVRANATQLQQVVMNLLTNASEALGDKGGAIAITTSLTHISEASGENGAVDLPAGDYIQLEVRDNGCGMPRHVQNRIFDPFFSTKFAGRGLGLAAVQGIMRNHGGAIRLVSSPGTGTCFTIFLPSIPAAVVPSSRIAAPTPDAAIVTASVLVVEDESALRLSVSNAMRRRGFWVTEAADGRAALDLFRAHADRIDVILLDMTLPGLSGRQLLTEFRRLKPGVKIILTTAYSESAIMIPVGEQPPSAFIRKPYKSDELTNLIRKVLAS